MKLPEINPHSILTQGPSLPFSPLPPCLPASPQSIGPSWRLDGLPDRHSSLWDMVDSFHAERTQADLTSRRQDHMAYKACAWHAMANLPPILLLSSFFRSPPLRGREARERLSNVNELFSILILDYTAFRTLPRVWSFRMNTSSLRMSSLTLAALRGRT